MKLYKIKPLDWDEQQLLKNNYFNEYHVAYSTHTEFVVVRINDVWYYEVFEDDTVFRYKCNSLEDGKNKCEEHHIKTLMYDLEEAGLEYNDMSM